MADFTGTAGDDSFTGTSSNDNFFLSQGGDDRAKGGAGNDVFYLGGALTAADRLDGQGDTGIGDTLDLDGDYSAGVTFRTNTVVGIERIVFHPGNDYELTLSDATVASGTALSVYGQLLGAGDSLWLDARHETDGILSVLGGAGDDTFFGGSGGDYFDASYGGADRLSMGAGDDNIAIGAALTRDDRLDGGDGFDSLSLVGDYSAGLKLGTKVVNFEELAVDPGYSYNLKTVDANVAAGQVLVIQGVNLGAADTLIFNGSAETDGSFTIYSGGGNDRITAGAGNDLFLASAGADIFTGGAGADQFVYTSLSQSSAAAPDRITDLTDSDLIDLSGIDANAIAAGNQAFTLVGHFDHTPGEAMLKYAAGSDQTTLSLDVDGDGVADGKILLNGDHSGFTHFVL